MEDTDFIIKLATGLSRYAPSYDIKIISPIIAMGCIESGINGTSSLSSKYFNHFGMKTGASWRGKGVNLKTQEVLYGQTVTLVDAFRVYDSFDAGCKGFFDFISTSRYANLKNVTDPYTFLSRIKSDGYATDPNYVSKCMNIVDSYNLIRYDDIEAIHYAVGCDYRIVADALCVRSGAGTTFPLIPHDELTPDGQRHDPDKNSSLEYGTIVTCLDIMTVDGDIWFRIPSGWVCAVYQGEKYII